MRRMPDELPTFRLRFPASWFAKAADPARRRLVPISKESALRSAQRITGLEELWSDPAFEERFELTISLLGGLDLNVMGRFMVAESMRWHLTNRLNLIHAQSEYPQVFERQLEAPIVIVGLFRTGTTFLHNV
ncbi:MAG: hypothetical protein KC561_20455, partial [Myxococcales bacterium]|nr:hypothetical protein [Myxococcales bacterium]